VFDEGTDLYFARNLINARLGAIKSQLPQELEPEMGPIATGLSEIYMYTLSATDDVRQNNSQLFDAIVPREIVTGL
jgi:cobalt-zinc-cadmium resistance protein CzcA